VAVPAEAAGRLADAHRHWVIMDQKACGSSVPTSCDFAGDSRRLPVGNLGVAGRDGHPQM
jgi:hypothetical protein